jgi:hypothetical protein
MSAVSRAECTGKIVALVTSLPSLVCLRMQLSGGATLIAIGAVLTALMCLTCFCIVKCARGIKSGKQQRPENPVGGTLYDVSAKYASPC